MEDRKKAGWRERLRDLYLTESPDEDGAVTNSVHFKWATFYIKNHDKKTSFYLTSQETLEGFIEELLGEQKTP